MLEYKKVVSEIEKRIEQYNDRSVGGGENALFYAKMANKLQLALTRLQDIGEEKATQQDLIVAWAIYRECHQKKMLKMCSNNGMYLAGACFLIGYVTSNIVHAIRNRN